VTDRRDLEASLAEMDRKLRELQRELALVSPDAEEKLEEAPSLPPLPPRAAPPPPPPPPAPPPGPAAETAAALEQATERVAELGRRIDELQRLRQELDEATRALREDYDRAVPRAAAPAPAPNPPAEAGPTAGLAPPPEPPPTAEPPPATSPTEAAFSGDVVINVGPFADMATLSAFELALSRLPGAADAYVRSFEGHRALVELRLEHPMDLLAELRRNLPFRFDVVAVGRAELTLTLGR
jgi:hypothetical protein